MKREKFIQAGYSFRSSWVTGVTAGFVIVIMAFIIYNAFFVW